MKEITFGKDQVIFREGDDARTMYDILSGKVGIYKGYGTEDARLRDYFKNKPEKLLQLMKVLSQRVRETTQKYMDVCRTINDHEKARLAENAAEMEKLRLEMEQYAGIYSNNWIGD